MPITPEIKTKVQELMQQIGQDAPVFATKMQARLAVINGQRVAEGKEQIAMVDWVIKILTGIATQEEMAAKAQQIQTEEEAALQKRLNERFEAELDAAEDAL